MISSGIQKFAVTCRAAGAMLFLACLSATAAATSRLADAEVRSLDGVPCFAIADSEVRRNGTPMIRALIVSDISVKPALEIWNFMLAGTTALPMQSQYCVRYGDAPAGAETAQAPSLTSGHVYSIYLKGKPNDPNDPTFAYMAKFCVLNTVAISRRVVQLRRSSQAWRDNSCLADSVPSQP